MSDTGRDHNLIPDDTQANYQAVRLERGLSWVELAEEFERQAEATTVLDVSYLRLAMWARVEAVDAGEVPDPTEREGTTPEDPSRSRRKRTTRQQPAPHRTDAPSTAEDATPAAAEAATDDVPVAV